MQVLGIELPITFFHLKFQEGITANSRKLVRIAGNANILLVDSRRVAVSKICMQALGKFCLHFFIIKLPANFIECTFSIRISNHSRLQSSRFCSDHLSRHCCASLGQSSSKMLYRQRCSRLIYDQTKVRSKPKTEVKVSSNFNHINNITD